MNEFTSVFMLFLFASLGVQLWLSLRQGRHVLAHRAEVPAAFAGRVSLVEHHKAADYSLAKGRLGRIELFWGTGLLLFWTLGGGLQWLDDLWRPLGWSAEWTSAAVFLSLLLIGMLLDLPFGLYRTFVLEARFGFNRTSPRLWLVDRLKGLALLLALGLPLLWLVLWLMGAAGSLWWLYVWGVWSGFSLLMIWAFPRFIAPLFNKFEPMAEGELRQRVEALLQRCGFSSQGLFVMDGSRRSNHGNAYFTGFGKNKRIVFFDTLLKDLSADQVEAVLAHELGHFHHQHIRIGLALSLSGSLIGLALLGLLMQQPAFFSGLGVSQPSNHMGLLLFMLVGPVFSFFLSPLFAALSRRHEFQADRYAAEQSRAQWLIEALVLLYRENAATLTPDPLHSAFYDSHPPAPIRIAALQRLDPAPV
ncbi:MAG: M48 family metallopeptidase [Gammaproteobacteria bacterium]|nr:M48 family metallopeptidase [Gammaproteobacteria bacterium]